MARAQRSIFGVALAALALSLPSIAFADGQNAAAYQVLAEKPARTDKAFAGGDDAFSFIVVGDRTGQHRPGIFEDALVKVEMLHPDFVINIGDLIEGNSEDRHQLDHEWSEVNAAIGGLSMPFFYVPGNHDLANDVQLSDWRQRLGSPYYSFIYKNALFLVLDTEDPPQPRLARKELMRRYGAQAMRTVTTALQGDSAQADALFAKDAKLAELAAKMRASENAAFSSAQLHMVRETLARTANVRWTFVLMHRPAWKTGSVRFREIETMLRDRPHTILAGHYHRYEHEQRGGHDYIQLGTTGGMPGGAADDPAVVDHLMWVSVARGAPRITNFRLDGLFGKNGPDSASQ